MSGGGGGGGGGKDRDKGKGASVSFTEGEKVLAYHGPLLYEAKMDHRSRLHRESSGRPRTGERPPELVCKEKKGEDQ
ncbi:hypothetical protein ZWY2020_029011 [Hordeum vulgare]|nr:hypothetical protein ZWY2020_029011 [Hordeum vulgare]